MGSAFAGPIPPPEILSGYRQILPDLPEKIVFWTENQMAHRMALERSRAEGSEARMDRGQVLAAGISAWGVTLAAIVGVFGNAWVAAILAIASIGGPTAAFVLARSFSWKGQTDLHGRVPSAVNANSGNDRPSPDLPDGATPRP